MWLTSVLREEWWHWAISLPSQQNVLRVLWGQCQCNIVSTSETEISWLTSQTKPSPPPSSTGPEVSRRWSSRKRRISLPHCNLISNISMKTSAIRDFLQQNEKSNFSFQSSAVKIYIFVPSCRKTKDYLDNYDSSRPRLSSRLSSSSRMSTISSREKEINKYKLEERTSATPILGDRQRGGLEGRQRWRTTEIFFKLNLSAQVSLQSTRLFWGGGLRDNSDQSQIRRRRPKFTCQHVGHQYYYY